MKREQAIKLLERLRMRTEQRGATPAEAAQAAELAQKIIARFNLSCEEQIEAAKCVETGQKQRGKWIELLGGALRKKFCLNRAEGIRTSAKNYLVRFQGPEHAVSVACWLFRAIELDMRKLAAFEAIKLDLKGADLVRFRSEFMYSCAARIYVLLNPWTEEEQARFDAIMEEDDCKPSKPKKLTALQLKQSLVAMQAARAGYHAAEQIKLGTDAVGGRSREQLLLGQSNNDVREACK
jgi:hypothetical protein